MTSGILSSGWCYNDETGSYKIARCRICKGRTTNKPIDCNSVEHNNYYTRNLRRQNELRSIHRIEILHHYGDCCACCGFDDFTALVRGRSVLELDHISGGGSQHNKRLKRDGIGWSQWFIRNNYPIGFRVLCIGCNAAIENNAQHCYLHKDC